jgi:HAE1 family hydrophobic/amphiphilic exporter-1
VATSLALSPVAAGLAHGSIVAEELATVVIGGLFSSTFLTLMVIPVIYSLVDGGKAGFRRRFLRGDAGAGEGGNAEDAGQPRTPAPSPAGGS